MKTFYVPSYLIILLALLSLSSFDAADQHLGNRSGRTQTLLYADISGLVQPRLQNRVWCFAKHFQEGLTFQVVPHPQRPPDSLPELRTAAQRRERPPERSMRQVCFPGDSFFSS